MLTDRKTCLPFLSKEKNQCSILKRLTLLSIVYPLKEHWSTREKVCSV